MVALLIVNAALMAVLIALHFKTMLTLPELVTKIQTARATAADIASKLPAFHGVTEDTTQLAAEIDGLQTELNSIQATVTPA